MKTARCERVIVFGIILASFSTAVLAAQAQAPVEGVSHHSFAGPITHGEVRYDIYLPGGYDSGNGRYPVVYFLHGLGGNETSDSNAVSAELEKAVKAGIVRPMIAVFANGYKDSMWADSKDGGKPAETNVIRELIPHIDSTYRTIADREHRVVMGFSMGGFGAVEYAVKFPDIFSVCVSYDGAMLDFEGISGRHGEMTAELFGGDEDYFNKYSPWHNAEMNAEKVRGKVAIRMVVGKLRVFNRRFKEYLDGLNIAVDYVETSCPHNPGCLYKQAGADSWVFIERHLAAPGGRAKTKAAARKKQQVVSPEVNADRTVTFRLNAAGAKAVRLNVQFEKQPQVMRKDEDGVWSVTAGPAQPGLYEYNFDVDGLKIADPVNPRVKVWLKKSRSILEIPGDIPMFFQRQDVPHGTIHRHIYKSRSLGVSRGLYVYTPSGYETGTERYPVLYLLHGHGDTEDAWTRVGVANNIVDNLLAGGAAKAMIIVMPYGHAVAPQDDSSGRNLEDFERDLLGDVIPLVEKCYRTRADQGDRAIVGLSMGGGQSLSIGLKHPELFGYVGGFSSSARRAIPVVKAIQNPEKLNERLKLLWIGCGRKDFLLKENKKLFELLEDGHIRFTKRITEGAHEWPVWRRYLNEFVPLLFQPKGEAMARKIPVILDTDICDDIDDTWALALLLKSPEFDIKLITTAVGDTQAKTKVVAKMLEVGGRTDIPIGTGLKTGDMSKGHRQDEWVRDFDLSKYPGRIYDDGVEALIETIMNSPRRTTLIAIGPVPNIAAAIEREPWIVDKVKFVGMHGSIRLGYGGKGRADKEYNVAAFAKAAQKVFTQSWDMTITPLDTCGIVTLKRGKYKKVLESDKRLAGAVIENYRAWARSMKMEPGSVDKASTTLFDTVAIYLAMSEELVEMENLGIRVTGDGHTVIDDGAKQIRCATKWKSLDGFEDFLVRRLTD